MTKLPTVNIKGKKYVVVNERLKFFRENHPNYSLETEIIEVNENTSLMRAVIRNEDDRIIATGVSFEKAGNGYINQTSHVENCETSAWGRALANFGIGIDETVASADEVVNAMNKQEEEPKPVNKVKPTTGKVMEYLTDCKDEKAVETIWKSAMQYEWSDSDMDILNTCKMNVLAKFQTKDGN